MSDALLISWLGKLNTVSNEHTRLITKWWFNCLGRLYHQRLEECMISSQKVISFDVPCFWARFQSITVGNKFYIWLTLWTILYCFYVDYFYFVLSLLLQLQLFLFHEIQARWILPFVFFKQTHFLFLPFFLVFKYNSSFLILPCLCIQFNHFFEFFGPFFSQFYYLPF